MGVSSLALMSDQSSMSRLDNYREHYAMPKKYDSQKTRGVIENSPRAQHGQTYINRMPNQSVSTKYSDTDSGIDGSNMGASTGLKMSNERRSDVTKAVNKDNPYPHGMA